MTLTFKSWRTTLSAVITILAGLPILADSLYAWSAHKPVNWRLALVSVIIALFSNAAGLLAAKDAAVHSTATEVETGKSEPLKSETKEP